MNDLMLHTPDGFRDIYDDDCRQKLELETRLREVMYSFGYRAIETPSVEFAEIFAGSEGGVAQKELYRFFDRDGSTMALRPDFTPSVARSAAKYFSLEEPVRLCYLGQTFVNHSSYKGMLKETTQLGAELMGDASPEADAEVLAMVIRSLLKAGLTDFQITVGHALYFESLVAQEDAIGRQDMETLKALIRNRNSFGVRDFLQERKMEPARARAIAGLPDLFGAEEVLEQARELAHHVDGPSAGKAGQAIDRLQQVHDILRIYGLEKYVTFDLAMLGSYMYYTGIIFRGYTRGSGDAVVKGGRYDHLLEQFGKEAPSTGFVIVIDRLLDALKYQQIGIFPERTCRRIECTRANREQALKEAEELRAQGLNVEVVYRG